MTTVTLIGRKGCHLCEVARDVIDDVVAALPESTSIVIVELSIDDDPALEELWREKIPVVLIDDRFHAHWRLDAQRLRDALAAVSSAESLR